MGIKHGNKHYLQILLDPNRAKLLLELAEEDGKRATAYTREAIYQHLMRKLPTSVYNEAEAKDKLAWSESVRRRVKGRMDAKSERKAETESEKCTTPE